MGTANRRQVQQRSMVQNGGRKRRRTMATLMLGLCIPALSAMSQDADKTAPVYKDAKSIEEPLDTSTGAEFQLGKDVVMRFPVGLPVGHSRLVTLKRGKGVSAKQVGDAFSTLGPTLDFNGALATDDEPIELQLLMKKDPSKAGKKLVLAMEVGTFCEEHNQKFKLKSGLCSGWEFVDAEYDSASGAVSAKLQSTGGLRLQFGLMADGE